MRILEITVTAHNLIRVITANSTDTERDMQFIHTIRPEDRSNIPQPQKPKRKK